ncbi:MAG: hypothetical protein JST38_03195 [Bacteroidetes bacterium]|nr:hypothetical protein [Bacteroidota bacterium]
MHGKAYTISLFKLALAALFTGLLLSTAVVPTLLGVSSGKVIAAPAPVEEEQHHAREVLKSAMHDHRAWAGRALQLDQSVKSFFSHGDEAVPTSPISEVRLQPPRTA